MAQLGARSAVWLGAPLVIEGNTIGVMAVQHYSDPDAYDEQSQHILEFVSAQVAIAIDRKRAEEKIRQRSAELAALNMAGQAVNAVATLEQVYAVGLKGIQNAVQPDLAFLFLRAGKRLLLKEMLPQDALHQAGLHPRTSCGRVHVRPGSLAEPGALFPRYL